MNFLLKEGKTNWKYILIVVILAGIVAGGILTWQYLGAKKEEIKPLEVKTPEEKVPEEKTIVPYIQVLSPNGGEIMKEGEYYTIKWKSEGLPTTAKAGILLFMPSGINATIARNIPVSQSYYNWKVMTTGLDWGMGYLDEDGNGYVALASNQTSIINYQYKIFIGVSQPNVWDYSDDYFAIIQSATIVTPPPSTWNTYTDVEDGFEIKYPNGTKIVENEFRGRRQIYMSLPFSKETNLIGKDLEIEVLTTEYWSGAEQPAKCHSDIHTFPSIINGIKFDTRDASGDFGGMETGTIAKEYCTMRGNKQFILTSKLTSFKYGEPTFDGKKESEIFTQMLSTFRFLE